MKSAPVDGYRGTIEMFASGCPRRPNDAAGDRDAAGAARILERRAERRIRAAPVRVDDAAAGREHQCEKAAGDIASGEATDPEWELARLHGVECNT